MAIAIIKLIDEFNTNNTEGVQAFYVFLEILILFQIIPVYDVCSLKGAFRAVYCLNISTQTRALHWLCLNVRKTNPPLGNHFLGEFL